MDLTARMNTLLAGIDNQVIAQQSMLKQQKMLNDSITQLRDSVAKESEELDVVSNAVAILTNISDDTVKENYKFIQDNINAALKKVFPEKLRQIRLVESMRGHYPQLEFKMYVGNDKRGNEIFRTIKSDSGHGVAQMVSLLSLMSLIVISGQRRFVGLDEMTSGMSGNTREVFDSILWAFAEIGFQFVLVDHGYIPKGAKVYVMESHNDIGGVVDTYIEQNGVYNEGVRRTPGYKHSNLQEEITE